MLPEGVVENLGESVYDSDHGRHMKDLNRLEVLGILVL